MNGNMPPAIDVALQSLIVASAAAFCLGVLLVSIYGIREFIREMRK